MSTRRAFIALTLVLTLPACASSPSASPYPFPLPSTTSEPTPAPEARSPAAPSPSASSPSPTGPARPTDPIEALVVATDTTRAIVAAGDRSESDRALDAGRHPAELLAFLGAAPGQRILEIGAWHGYTAELLARAIAPNGTVYAQDPPAFDKLTRDAWAARAQSAPLKYVVRVSREFADPVPPNERDRAGVADAKTLHRIDEKVVRAEIEAAGFKLAATAGFLRNPNDTRDWSASDEAPKERRGTSDRFVLKYVKP